jgi:ubiquinone/menaquinone biosynthesis C-methylase UbiE
MTESVRHPIFARFYARFSKDVEAKGAAEHRAEMLEGLSGRVIEVGAGNGLNFEHYPESVSEVVAVEPEPFLRGRAEEAASSARVPIRVVAGTADELPAEDASFDAGVALLVLCSVADPQRALAELFRVLRPGGELRFYEHVLADNPVWARRQHRAAPLWRRLGGGCHPDRDTGAHIRSAGFEVERMRSLLFAPNVLAKLVAPHIVGRARRPTATIASDPTTPPAD